MRWKVERVEHIYHFFEYGYILYSNNIYQIYYYVLHVFYSSLLKQASVWNIWLFEVDVERRELFSNSVNVATKFSKLLEFGSSENHEKLESKFSQGFKIQEGSLVESNLSKFRMCASKESAKISKVLEGWKISNKC